MAQVLVIYAHPVPARSRVNRLLAAAARAVPGVAVHELYESYPDFYIDVSAEREAVTAADVLVFMHPLSWYSMPALLKEWLDTVLDPAWAYASQGGALRGKGYWVAVTAASADDCYDLGGDRCRPFADLLAPFELTARVCGMEWLAPHVLQAANSVDDAVVDAHVAAFRARLEGYAATHSSPAPAPGAAVPHG